MKTMHTLFLALALMLFFFCQPVLADDVCPECATCTSCCDEQTPYQSSDVGGLGWVPKPYPESPLPLSDLSFEDGRIKLFAEATDGYSITAYRLEVIEAGSKIYSVCSEVAGEEPDIICFTDGTENTGKIKTLSFMPLERFKYCFKPKPIANELTSFYAVAENQANVVSWQASVEINLAGYNLYRSATENGNFVRLNENLFTAEDAVSTGRYQYTDKTAVGVTNYYKLEEISLDGALKTYGPISVSSATWVAGQIDLPTDYFLAQNYPNPFNPMTTIEFVLPADQKVNLVIYDLLGHKIAILADGYFNAGQYKIQFDASGLESGVYFYKLTAGQFTQHRKMMLVR